MIGLALLASHLVGDYLLQTRWQAERVKALTLTQPWATLVALGKKRVETRSWMTHYRGPLAIHAAKGLSSIGGKRGLRALCKEPPFSTALYDPSDPYRRIDARLPFGAIVAVVELVDVFAIVEGMSLPPEMDGRVLLWTDERHFGDYTPGRYAWLLGGFGGDPARPLVPDEPIPCAGTLGLWDPPLDVEAKLQALRARGR